MGAAMMAPSRPAVSFYRSHVAHVRLRPRPHRFSYIVPSIALDLDRLDEADNTSAVFSIGRFNLLSFYPGDHGAGERMKLRDHVEALLLAGGLSTPLARIELVCTPRVLGSGFNPLSVYYCSSSESLTAIIYEVRNTFGERHSYVVPASKSADGAVMPRERDKIFYVSPFMDMAMRYRFLTRSPGDTLNLKIIVRDVDGVMLTALLCGQRVQPHSIGLTALALRQWLGGLKVLSAIHFEALRLWLKGYRLYPRPDAPPQASFGETGAYTRSKQSS
jgi:DUF1365 family protein